MLLFSSQDQRFCQLFYKASFFKKHSAESSYSNLKFENVSPNESICKPLLTCYSGAQVGWIHETNANKSRDTASLSCQVYTIQRRKALFTFCEVSISLCANCMYSRMSMYCTYKIFDFLTFL